MLEQAEARATTLGLARRIRTVEADLDGEPLPVLGTLDLARAGMSLHHLRRPERLLTHVHEQLSPTGHIAVVEFGLPRPVSNKAGREHGEAAPGHQVINWGNYLEKAAAAAWKPVFSL